MEHLVQFTFSVDDESIQRRLEASAYDDVVGRLVKSAESSLPKMAYTGGKVDWKLFTEGAVKGFLEEHKCEIVEAAARALAERLARTKAVKCAVEEALR